jgi:hypothetical protein
VRTHISLAFRRTDKSVGYVGAIEQQGAEGDPEKALIVWEVMDLDDNYRSTQVMVANRLGGILTPEMRLNNAFRLNGNNGLFAHAGSIYSVTGDAQTQELVVDILMPETSAQAPVAEAMLDFDVGPLVSIVDTQTMALSFADRVQGEYKADPLANDWGWGTIQLVDGKLRWDNKAGRSWGLVPDEAQQRLTHDAESPYHGDANYGYFHVKLADGQVTGISQGEHSGILHRIGGVPVLALEMVPGTYHRDPVQNDWHAGTITQEGGALRWTNQAGVGWSLTPDLANQKLITGTDNPYYQQGWREFELVVEGGRIVGFRFQTEMYNRK